MVILTSRNVHTYSLLVSNIAMTQHQEAVCTSIQAIVEMKAVLPSHVPAAGLAASAPHDDWPAPFNSA
jgi:hypothetical protein